MCRLRLAVVVERKPPELEYPVTEPLRLPEGLTGRSRAQNCVWKTGAPLTADTVAMV
jgi:hypothetical protein